MLQPQIDEHVQMYNPGDYTHGRKGIVKDVDKAKCRALVFWNHKNTYPDGQPRKGNLTTWVNFSKLVECLNPPPGETS